MQLSDKALHVIHALFSDQSNLQLPVAVADAVLEIRVAIAEELSNRQEGAK